MKRVLGWEKLLNAAIEKHRALPSVYGISDCYLIADDCVNAVTGSHMYPDVSYNSELAAAKELISHGFKTVEDAFAAKFESVAPSLAHRGDIGVMLNAKGELCGGVFTSIGFMTRDEKGVIFVPFTSVKSAFKVGR